MRRANWCLLTLLLSIACGRTAPAPETDATEPASESPAPAATTSALPDIVARVNGEPIERWELENAVRASELSASAPVPAERRGDLLRELLAQLVDLHLLGQEARARQIAPTDDEVAAQLDQIRQEFPSEDAFAQALSEDGTSLDRVERDVVRRLSVGKLLDMTVLPTISVTDADIRAYYDQNVERFNVGESVRASHILITVAPEAGDAERQRARVKADELLNKLRAGADFEALARAESQDPGSAPQGGDLGFFAKGQMVPAFEAAVFSLEPGAVSPVVETQYGFHIIRQTGRQPPRTAPYAEVRQQVEQLLQTQQAEVQTAELVRRLTASAVIEIYL